MRDPRRQRHRRRGLAVVITAEFLVEQGIVRSEDLPHWRQILADAEPGMAIREVRQRIKTLLMRAFPELAPTIGRLGPGRHDKALSLGLPADVPDAEKRVEELRERVRADFAPGSVVTPRGLFLRMPLPESVRRHCRIDVTDPRPRLLPLTRAQIDASAAGVKGEALDRLRGEAELDALLAAPEAADPRGGLPDTPAQALPEDAPAAEEPWEAYARGDWKEEPEAAPAAEAKQGRML